MSKKVPLELLKYIDSSDGNHDAENFFASQDPLSDVNSSQEVSPESRAWDLLMKKKVAENAANQKQELSKAQADATGGSEGEYVPVVPVSPYAENQNLSNQYDAMARRAIQTQNFGIKDLKDYLSAYKTQPMNADLSPLMQYVDSLGGGTKLAETYKRPESANDKLQKLFELQQGVQKAQQASTGDELGLLKNRLAANLENAKLKMYESIANNRDINANFKADILTNKVVNDINKDKALQDLSAQKRTIDRGLHTLDNSTVLAPQTLSELETEISKALAGNSMATEGAVHRQEMQTAARKIAEYRQQIGNEPIDMRTASPEIVKYIRETMQRLQEGYAGDINRRVDQLTKGKNFKSGQVRQGLEEAAAGYKSEVPKPQMSKEEEKAKLRKQIADHEAGL